jgi:glycine betaine/proline transport system permease protein
MEFFTKFPVMERVSLLELKKGIDLSFRLFSRKYGDGIEAFFDPLLFFLVWLEKLLLKTPWPIIILVVATLAWFGSRSWKLVVGSAIAFMLIGYFGMWNDCMATVAIISVCTIICIAIGIPIGVVMSNLIELKKLLYQF